ncbi:hypothetical protein GTW43_26750 [Streptomyces sp. SID5785]|uniref:FG-GAP-like repeat-containing protein n=1 Tax=Streptomyces sp. SID5785 TaxID=2690309 RepID=UPI001360F54F|nr:VCBS repeat-containing protein [Streptomyces sp. SID5785]MZD08651.1 hypothetical protein [Streptomyces sp. SID5785]
MDRSSRRRRARRPRLPLAAACAALLLAVSCTGAGGGSRDGAAAHADPGRCTTPRAAAASPAPTARPARRTPPAGADFDGDGRHDLFLEGRYGKPGTPSRAAVVLLLGARGGAPAGRTVSVTGRFPGLVPGAAENSGDITALTHLSGDWDADGRTDLLLRVFRSSAGAHAPTYRPVFVWGGTGGLAGTRAELPATDAPPVAAGDFDGDGRLDLVSGPFTATADRRDPVRCAAVDFGPFDRDGRPAQRRYVDVTRRGTVFADRLTAGDFDGDGRDEFVVEGDRGAGSRSTRSDDDGAAWSSYAVDAAAYRYGPGRTVTRTGGLRALGDGRTRPYDPEDDSGTPPPLTAPSGTLTARTTGDFDGDGRTDLLTGRTDMSTGERARVVYGGRSGPCAGRAPTEPPTGDRWTVADVTGDGRDDLVTGDVTGALNRAGTVSVFPGGPHGLAARATVTFDRDDVGMTAARADAPAGDRDLFGGALAAADLDGDGAAELAVLTQDFRSVPGTHGTFWIVPGGARGPVPGRAFALNVEHVERAGRSGRD